jgi:urea carboxylase-associated protein 2
MAELLATLPPLARAAVPPHSSRYAAERVLWEEALPGGCHWSAVLRRGTTLRLVDLEGRANVSALFHNHEQPSERYNMPDTLKAQHTAHLTAGCVCYSDMGRVLCAIADDSCGWHDPLCGALDAATLQAKYGAADYQTHRNAMYRAGHEGLLVELAKWGLGRRDMAAPLNLFSKVVADAEGRLRFDASHRRPGQHVDLRFEMDVLVALSAAPHPLDPSPAYAPGPVALTAWRSGTAGADDACRLRCPENERGYVNTERYFLR